MFFANNYHDCRTHIDETQSNKEYYCPYCGAPLTMKKGDVRQHHFSHKQGHVCSDSWERNRSYNTSPWHNDWQNLFPRVNQEVKLALGETTHRADVMVGRTVIEFQHSNMQTSAFEDRNNFYLNLGCKVVWLFDMSDLYQSGALHYENVGERLAFKWKNPKRAFNYYDIESGNIDLFFQLSKEDDNCIVRVVSVSDYGFERFETFPIIDKKSFLKYVGLENGYCSEPFKYDTEQDKHYESFCEKYQIALNKQQERAVLSVDGAVLLLAVPGSGKTTVLINRIGHMVLNRHIDPRSILALTYGKDAAQEMRKRFSSKFGERIGEQVAFRTINSVSLEIYLGYCRANHLQPRQQLETFYRRKILREACQTDDGSTKYIPENDIIALEQAIGLIKNLMLREKGQRNLEHTCKNLRKKYEFYQKRLNEKNAMDFDDQMVFALAILKKYPSVLNEWRRRYKYICVDEAQDTSKIQHEIIRLLADGNNIFMVGDEDQSIYGFRGAYPKAFLNFRYDYCNPYILKMEQNYRSTTQIVNLAQRFIAQNKGRYEKKMVSARGSGTEAEVISCHTRQEQYDKLLSFAEKRQEQTAFLYRDNESSVVLVDLFLRHNIDYRMRRPEFNFFRLSTTRDIVSYLSLTIDDRNTDALEQICNHGILFLKKQQLQYAIKNCKTQNVTVFDALDEQMEYVKSEHKTRARDFREFISKIAGQPPVSAIDGIMEYGYRQYLQNEHMDAGKIEILRMIAKHEESIEAFLNRLSYLEQAIQRETLGQGDNPVILSTIHSSKGLEYNSVYMVDVYDGRFPTASTNLFSQSKDNANGDQEERRLFYVGITRAANKLVLFDIEEHQSTYIYELFPQLQIAREHKEQQEAVAERQGLVETQQKRKETYETQRRFFQQLYNKQSRQNDEQTCNRDEVQVNMEHAKANAIISVMQEETHSSKKGSQDVDMRNKASPQLARCIKCGNIKGLIQFSPDSIEGTDRLKIGILVIGFNQQNTRYRLMWHLWDIGHDILGA